MINCKYFGVLFFKPLRHHFYSINDFVVLFLFLSKCSKINRNKTWELSDWCSHCHKELYQTFFDWFIIVLIICFKTGQKKEWRSASDYRLMVPSVHIMPLCSFHATMEFYGELGPWNSAVSETWVPQCEWLETCVNYLWAQSAFAKTDLVPLLTYFCY